MKKISFLLIAILFIFYGTSKIEARPPIEWFPLDQEETLLIDLKSIQKRNNPDSKDEVYRFDLKQFNRSNDVTPTKRAPYEFWILDMEVNFTTNEFATRVILYYEDWNGRVTRVERHVLKGEDAEWRPIVKGQVNHFILERMKDVIKDNQEDLKDQPTYYR